MRSVLLVDGNWWLQSRLAVLRKDGLDGFGDNDAKLLMSKLTQDLAAVVRTTNSFVSGVVVAKDSRSWRKDIDRLPLPWEDADDTDTRYKAHREADEQVNWQLIWQTYDQWCDAISKLGVFVCQIRSLEADDILVIGAGLLLKRGISSIILSSDADLIQTVDCQNSQQSMLWLQRRKKIHGCWNTLKLLYCNKEIKPDSIDMFATSLVLGTKGIETPVTAMLSFFDNVVYDNRATFLLFKALMGDASDGIPAAVFYQPNVRVNWAKHHQIGQAVEEHCDMANSGFTFSDITEQQIYDKTWVAGLIDRLAFIVSKGRADHGLIEHYNKRYWHNLSLIHISPKHIPRTALNQLIDSWEIPPTVNELPIDAVLAHWGWLPDDKVAATIEDMDGSVDIGNLDNL